MKSDRTTSAKETILQLEQTPVDTYSQIDLNRLTAYTILKLKELDVPCTIENIAVANHRMFPRRFAMVGFPEYPDVSRVNRALLQLRPKYRNWATGNARLGWALTAAGYAEARAIADQLTGKARAPSSGRVEAEPAGIVSRTIHPDSVIRRVRETSLYQKWKQNRQDLVALEVFDVLDAYTHTPASVLRGKLREISRVASDVEADDVQSFLDAIMERFPSLFQK
jgi:hypothetical protein